MRTYALLAPIALGAAVMAPAIAGAQPGVITNTSINGVGTGRAASAYRTAFGRSTVSRLEGGLQRLDFRASRTEVYFKGMGAMTSGIAVVTGNPAYRTASGVGPCSTYAELKAAMPTLAAVPKSNGEMWRSGRLWFRVYGDNGPSPGGTPADADVVRAVMLTTPRANPSSFAFIGNTATACTP